MNHVYNMPLYGADNEWGHFINESFTDEEFPEAQVTIPSIEWIDAINILYGKRIYETIDNAIKSI